MSDALKPFEVLLRRWERDFSESGFEDSEAPEVCIVALEAAIAEARSELDRLRSALQVAERERDAVAEQIAVYLERVGCPGAAADIRDGSWKGGE